MEKAEYAIMYEIEQSYWWFIGKQFLVKSIFRGASLCEPSQDRILDIGCGTGTVLKLLEEFGTAYGAELSPDAIRFLKKRDLHLVVRSDVSQSLSFKDGVFSAVTCLDVLEHVHDDFTLLSEMVRVCRPGGYIIVTVPALNVLWSSHDVALHHKRRYTKKRLLEKVSPLSASVIKKSYYNTALILPILAVRKLKGLFPDRQSMRSDFFMPMPRWINDFLTTVSVTEIRFLKRVNFPFGVSLLLIMQKSGDHAESRIQDDHA